MNEALNFVKKHRFDIIVTCSLLAFSCDVYFRKHIFWLAVIALYIIGYAADSGKSRTNIAERKALHLRRGLTKEDLNNIKFVKSWEDTRKKGLVKYSLIYGGVFFGFILCGIISIVILLAIKNTLGYISADPSHMINFIGYTYIAGIIGGTLLYRFLWVYNEHKFIRLTDPLH